MKFGGRAGEKKGGREGGREEGGRMRGLDERMTSEGKGNK